MIPTKITLYHVLWFACFISGAMLGSSVGLKYFGVAGGILGGITGMVSGFIIGGLPETWATKRFFKNIEQSSNEELWRIVNLELSWNFYQTMALLQLAAREQDVSGELPRIIRMLESEEVLTRRYGWDALRLVFPPETEQIGDYDPKESAEICRQKTERLKTHGIST